MSVQYYKLYKLNPTLHYTKHSLNNFSRIVMDAWVGSASALAALDRWCTYRLHGDR